METDNILQSLQKTFGGIPQQIREHLKYFKYDDEDDAFTCNVCERSVQVHHTNQVVTTANFKRHLDSRMHTSKTSSQGEIWNRLNSTFQNLVPKLVRQNVHVLGTDGDDYYCEICEKTLRVSSQPSVSEKNFAQHILTDDQHGENLKTYNENLSLLEDIYGAIPCAVFHNSQYLKLAFDGKNYVCTICKVALKVNQNNLEGTIKLFTEHLETEPHVGNSRQARAASRIPQLRQIYGFPIPWYVLKNIEYLSVNQTEALYCSLCDDSFGFSPANVTGSKESLRQHIFSRGHGDELKNRRDQNDEDYSKLSDLIDSFDEEVLNKLDCLSIYEDKLECKICMVYINEDLDSEDLKDDIESHLNSNAHDQMFSEEKERQSDLLDDLEDDVFGKIPECIENELSHIEYRGQGTDFYCTLCDKTLKACVNGDYDRKTSITEVNFSKHFDSEKHQEKSEAISSWDDTLEKHLESLFSPSPIPQYMWINLDYHLGYEGDNEENDFYCFLCETKIGIASGTKANELTVMEISKHFLSPTHLTQLKNKAYKKYVAKCQLKSIFGGVSNLILNNIKHLEHFEDRYRCKICDVQILIGSDAEKSEKNFHSHLNGEMHQSELRSREEEYGQAMSELENRFSFIPECLLKNMDFVKYLNDGDIYCEPCQETLTLGESLSDIHTLRYHFESKAHEHNVGIY